MSILADRSVDAGRLRVGPVVDAQRGELLRLLGADRFVGAPVEARVRAARSMTAHELGGSLLGVTEVSGRLRAVALDAGALQPVGGDEAAWTALGAYLAGRPRRCSSLVGRADAVRALWPQVERAWDVPRAIRSCQPLLVIDRAAALPEADPRVRVVRMADLDSYVPAAVAMFTEELGISPIRGADSERGYRARIAGLISARRALGIFDADGTVLFKADLGCVTPATCQVQGLWVRPDARGRGIATGALAAVLRAAFELAPTVSLYVNDFNTPARRLYRRLGMAQEAVLSTVLF